jgi:hypothetical protein
LRFGLLRRLLGWQCARLLRLSWLCRFSRVDWDEIW